MSPTVRFAIALGLVVVGVFLIVLGIQAILIAMTTPPSVTACPIPVRPAPSCPPEPWWQTYEAFVGILSTAVGTILVTTGTVWALIIHRRNVYWREVLGQAPAQKG